MRIAEMIADVEGFLSGDEVDLLHNLASQISDGGSIVEIGSYRGKSTIALALGAKEAGGILYAIDHHPTYEIDGTAYSMVDNQAYYANIAKYNVGNLIRTINLSSNQAYLGWNKDIDLLWIDGDHEFEQVYRDWYLWSNFAQIVALHDTAGFHVGIDRLVVDIIASGNWERTEVVDATSVFKWVGGEK